MIKIIHLSTVFISIGLFSLRFYWLMTGSVYLRQLWVRILPHINDSILLVSAIILSVQIQQYPLVHHWLTIKVIALLVYIGFGMGVFRFAKTRRAQISCFIFAIISFLFIVSVARSHSPLGALSWI